LIVACLFSLSGKAQPQDTIENTTEIILDPAVSFRGIHAFDDRTVWVSGSRGSVFSTTDAGQSWRKIVVPAAGNRDFRDVQLLSDRRVLLLSVGEGDQSAIFRSEDGGVNWSKVFSNPHPQGFLDAMAFWDDREGLALGDPVDGRIYIIRTRDAGKTWREIEFSQRPPALVGESHFAASGTCLVVFGHRHAWIGSGGSTARLFRSRDQGNTWEAFPSPLLSGASSQGIFSIFFRNRQNGWIAGGDYQKVSDARQTLALTTDGGKTWESIPDGTLPFQSALAGATRNSKAILVSTGPDATFLNRDGRKWEKTAAKGYHCLSIASRGKIAWLAGSGGRVAALPLT